MHGLGAPGRGDSRAQEILCEVVEAPGGGCPPPVAPKSSDEVMTRKPDIIRPEANTLEALRMMEDGGYRHLPVVNGQVVIGVVSRRDFFGEEKAQLDRERVLREQVG